MKRVLPVLGYLALTFGLTVPLLRNLGSTIVSNEGDPALNTYILNWGASSLFHDLLNIYNASFFFPSRNTLSLSDHLFSVSWPLAPLLLVKNPLVFYNVAFVASFFLSAWFFFRYLRALELDLWPAWTGGVLFGFLPWRYGQLGHAQLLFSWWVPFTLEQFEHWRRRPSWPRAALTGLGFALVFLASVYQGFFFFFFFAVYALFRTLSPGQGRPRASAPVIVGHALLGGAVSLAVLAPSLLAYDAIPRYVRLSNTISAVAPRGADVTDYLNAPSLSFAWSWLSRKRHPYSDVPWEMMAFPGGLPLTGLIVGGVLVTWLRRSDLDYKHGPGAAVPGLLVASAVAFFFSLGPILHLGGSTIGRSLPYQWFFHCFSPLRAIRVPARASFFVALAGAAVVAILVDKGCARLRGTLRRCALGLFPALALLDVWPHPLPVVAPTNYLRLRSAFQATNSAVGREGSDLVLPIDDAHDFAAPAASVGPFRPLVNGCSGYLLRENGLIFEKLSHLGPEFFNTLETLNVRRLFLDRTALGADLATDIRAALLTRAARVRLVATVEDYEIVIIDWSRSNSWNHLNPHLGVPAPFQDGELRPHFERVLTPFPAG